MTKPSTAPLSDDALLDRYQQAHKDTLAAADRQWGDAVFGRVLAGVATSVVGSVALALAQVPTGALTSPMGKAAIVGTVVAGVAAGAWKLGNLLREESAEWVGGRSRAAGGSRHPLRDRSQECPGCPGIPWCRPILRPIPSGEAFPAHGAQFKSPPPI